MANILYDKTVRSPPVGSLKEALFLTIWLKRQEADLARLRLVATGFAASAQDASAIDKSFQTVVALVFPFLKQSKEETDKKLVEVMNKEVAKGPIFFTPAMPSPLRTRAAQMRVPDDFREKMANRRARRP